MTLALATGSRRRLMHSYPVGCLAALGCLPAERMPAVRGLHDVVQNLYLLRKLGIEPDVNEAPWFLVNDVDRARAADLFSRVGLPADARPIAIHPGSARTVLAKAKRWPPEMYAHLLLRLQGEYPNHIVILEGPDEAGVGAEILHAAAPVIVPVLRLSGPLGDTAAVLERSAFYVGSDSGLAHLSAAVGTPPVTLFAPADPERCSPFGYRSLVVQPQGRPCAPCFMYPWHSTKPRLRCADARCIHDITVEQVMHAARRAHQVAAGGSSPDSPPEIWTSAQGGTDYQANAMRGVPDRANHP
jgi:ADP-heptose:LPS heptosyltransferase